MRPRKPVHLKTTKRKMVSSLGNPDQVQIVKGALVNKVKLQKLQTISNKRAKSKGSN